MAQIRYPTQEVSVSRGSPGKAGMGQQIGAAIGGVAGAMTGSPVAAVQGAATGAGIGGMAGGMIDPGRQGSVQQPQQSQGIQMQQGAIDRRLGEIQQNPHFALQQAKAALPQLPQELQQQYAPTIEMALEASRRAQAVGRKA